MSGGCFHSGDLGVLDQDRYITVVDRKKDRIKTGGENVALREAEAAAYPHPGVEEVGRRPEREGGALWFFVGVFSGSQRRLLLGNPFPACNHIDKNRAQNQIAKHLDIFCFKNIGKGYDNGCTDQKKYGLWGMLQDHPSKVGKPDMTHH